MEIYPLTILYDESCPLCKLEIDNLRARNQAGQLRFIDVSAPDYDVSLCQVAKADLMRIIHALRADGQLVHGMEVFRLAYEAVGLGWITVASGWPLLKPVFDWIYPHIANNRGRLSEVFTGSVFRLVALLALRRSQTCKTGVCAQLDKKDA
ncbi:DUF393 domain-containing protein [Undibacterium sp. CY7W]|uniref:DUF393 domain-containing protein n=1 Tax=Undibacterium rugosum TaxID=2762291 RepID=A0A923ICK9_9BURK|nr:DUF393 domain-containing protein [Undibacterium rugosum]MBC3936975.1 DUF393 domain-containing protein [Undibacterium rugosum]